MIHGKLEIYHDKRPDHERISDAPDPWRWRVKAGNGEIVASGEGYGSERDAIRGFEDAARAMATALCSADRPRVRPEGPGVAKGPTWR
jgi:hypothetical protein